MSLRVELLAEGAAAVYGLLFVLAAASKLDAWGRWAAAAAEFVPKHGAARRLLVFGLPIAEASVAGTIFVAPAAGLAAAAALLGVMAVGVALLMARHRGAECRCFGAVTQSRIGPLLALRNVTLAAGAASFAAVARRDGVGPPNGAVVVLCAILALVILLAAEWRQLTRLRTSFPIPR
jgi:hypothetical protein